eukprot:GEMP01045238.1.p1 GENE.GEMP01045238.1~~GEMP01045238.1.p1  ORF type:complete len:511 (+),score=94.34 GEMP01045238.1:156-1688(+)
MLLFSWNVAGWSTTYEIICQHYGSFENYFDKHGRPSVICLQETKIPRGNLQTSGLAKNAGACPTGWKSYWAPNRQKTGTGKSGFNGVATFVRDDLPVVGATQSPLEDDELDAEGRCLLVDFGSFVVFNVYAPHVGKPEDKQRKQRFLEALQRAMDRCRSNKQHVVLMGDMNITYRYHDSKTINRWLKLDDAGQVQDGPWKVDDPEFLGRPLVPIRYFVENNIAELSEFTNRGEVHHFPSEPHSVRWMRSLVPADALRRDCDEADLPFRPDFERKMADDLETAQVDVSETKSSVQAAASPAHASVGEKENNAHTDSSSSSTSAKADSGSRQTRFVYRDAFASLFPHEKERFTCWNQTRNFRYKNIGSRLDYTIVDDELWELVDKKPLPLFGGPGISGAHAACTLNGRWKEAPVAGPLVGLGLSLQRDDMSLNDQQFLPPSTGIVYTPPSYSDHVAVTLKLARHPDEIASNASKSSWPVKLTRACQPWTQYTSAASFFKLKDPKKKKIDEST